MKIFKLMIKGHHILLLSLFISNVFSQEISGKWYGKLTQGPGGYNDLYDLELSLNQKKNIFLRGKHDLTVLLLE